MARRKGEAQQIGALLRRYIRDNRMHDQVMRSALQLRWEEAVGGRLASRTRPGSLYRGKLKVRVANSTWLNELNFMRDEIIERINSVMGQGTVRELSFYLGRLDPPPKPAPREVRKPSLDPPPRPRQEVPDEASREVERAVEDLDDPELKKAIREAWLAELARGREENKK